MNDCGTLRDRMPDVAHGTGAWTGAEADHLAGCADCALEWRIVRAGVALNVRKPIAADQLATALGARLRDAAATGRVVGRLTWRAAATAVVAAAAGLVLFIQLARHDGARPPAPGDTIAAVAMIPELQGLDAAQLQTVLRSLGPSAADATPGVLPHLEDLTDSELEQLLRAEGRMKGRHLVGSLALLGILAAPAPAQRVGQRPARAAVIQNIEQLFLKQVMTEMALAPEVQPRFQRVVIAWGQKRGTLEAEERQLRQSLRRELTPGVAANPDSVSRFVDALNNNRVAYAESFRDEMRELAPILNPVQRGQFQVRRDQLLQRVRELQQQRPGGALDASGVPEP